MLVIGERINATRKSMGEAITKKDSDFIRQEAVKQLEAGADILDVNCGMSVKDESSNMEWLVNTVQDAADTSLVIDSPNPAVIESGLKLCRKKAIVNSITGEKERIEKIMPLVEKYNADVIALTMDEKGMPNTSEERYNIAEKIADSIKKYKVPLDRVYFDLLVRPISTEPNQANEFLGAVSLVKKNLKAKTVCGLSNISFGLPNRKLINATFLTMSFYAGLDAAIIDPTDKNMMLTIRSSEALLARDEYCLKYITAFREGK
ncbi:MAG: methyltetrahydrofolate cobalamin methyltransferase [Elusimicrobia bacterium]|nr:methyltetrahydrofolate cobalamin methyltransferase [Elusimicrobiota bacterium]